MHLIRHVQDNYNSITKTEFRESIEALPEKRYF